MSSEHERADVRLVIGKAFMRMMGDVLGEADVFEKLQSDNYWWVDTGFSH